MTTAIRAPFWSPSRSAPSPGPPRPCCLAPQSGEETRHLLAEKAREGREKANESAQRGKEFLDRQRETLAAAIDKGKDAYQRARGGAEEQA